MRADENRQNHAVYTPPPPFYPKPWEIEGQSCSWSSIASAPCILGIMGYGESWERELYVFAWLTMFFARLPLKLTLRLQSVHNVVAWIPTGTPWTPHIHPVLRQLHWLQVEWWVRFKLLVLTFKPLNGQGSMYLWNHLSWCVPWRPLCSGEKNLLEIPDP